MKYFFCVLTLYFFNSAYGDSGYSHHMYYNMAPDSSINRGSSNYQFQEENRANQRIYNNSTHSNSLQTHPRNLNLGTRSTKALRSSERIKAKIKKQNIKIDKRVKVTIEKYQKTKNLEYSLVVTKDYPQEIAHELTDNYHNLFTYQPKSSEEEVIKTVGLRSSIKASMLFSSGENETAQIYRQYANLAFDILIGIDPITGTGRDFYEAFTGINMITGKLLSDTERILAGVSVLTLGSLSKAGKVIKASATVFNRIKATKTLLKSEELIKSSLAIGLKSNDEVRNSAVFLANTIKNNDFSQKNVSSILQQTGANNLRNYSEAVKVLSKKGFSKNSDEFISKQILYSERILGKGKHFTKDDLVRMVTSYDQLSRRITDVVPITFSGKVWRAVPETVKENTGKVIAKNTDETVYNTHNGMKLANGRYSAPGESAIYTSIGKETDAWETVMEELGSIANKPLRLEAKHYKLDKVLDLTDAKIRNELGISGSELLKNTDEFLDAYEITHQLGSIAKKKGFNGIRVPSEPNRGGINMIILGD